MQITDPYLIDTYYQALLERKSNFVGIFYVGVKTTSIFCIATCRARKPKRENVIFYDSVKDALDNGFRPCKICKPTENAEEAPAPVLAAIQLVQANPKEKVSDDMLRANGIAPEMVRRWFNKTYGVTFQTYQRMYRVNTAYQELKQGKKATATAYDSGYESLSGFGYTYKKMLGNSPQNSLENDPILLNRVTTPLGPMFIGATTQGICLLEFTDRKRLETELKDLQRLLKTRIIAGENEHIKQVKKELAEYFEGKRKTFEVALHTPGTDFQNQVWKALDTIAYGTTATYTEQAQKIDKTSAVRAVGTANGANRISIIIPCHRVVGTNGKLTGYGGGLARKQWLIDFERNQA
ncbi:XRE family transcriptional regulator [marine bacterium AO1-C]|nr:XRE family transcriptional regulator [marine bacterium AO1-C]